MPEQMDDTTDFAQRVKRGEYAVRLWLATTFTGSLVKVSLGAALGYVMLTFTDWPPLAAAVGVVAVPLVINALNSADGRYGIGKDEFDPSEPDDEFDPSDDQ
jgi:hypothetical protein